VKKCPYCDFNSHEKREELPQSQYINALIADLESGLPQIWGRPVSSIFIGGGTPSLFMPEAFDTLLAAVRARVSLLPNAEITLEANPGTVDAAKFEGFRAAGINRISIGIQSFDDDKLKALGRIHSADEAKRAIEMAQRHFDNINLDLMYALPQQSLEQARRDIGTAIGFGTAHLSAYHLTLEPNTPFHRSPPPLPDNDASADMQEMIEATLEDAGFEHYETSAFAKPNHLCRHNLNYWNFGDYLGIGAGAHGKLTSHSGVIRETRRKHPKDYLQAATRGEFALERRAVTARELPFEFMMNALRLCGGFPTRLYQERTGLALPGIQNHLLAAQRDGLLKVGLERIAPTIRGQRFLNELLRRFLPDE
jgi:oxygen-independent coproporphyrinogen-3 oxidase